MRSRAILASILIGVTLAPAFALAAVDVTDTSKFTYNSVLGQYVEIATGNLFDASGEQVQLNPGGGATQINTGRSSVKAPISCDLWQSYIINLGPCFGRSMSYFIGSTLIYIGAWLLALAGTIFNWLIEHTVIQFATLYQSIKPAVENAWTAFRDVANILIIGMFTFIAICIILDVKEFGDKKLVAKVLVIAVLINFSLLFAKIIIDGSNFAATQLYAAAGFQSGSDAGQPVNASSGLNPFSGGYSQAGVAGQFINLMGVRSLQSTWQSLSDIARANDSGWIALLNGIFAALVLFAAAAVLLYGAFLLAARTIVIIMLFVTASLAFASYLIPKWSGSSYGWSKWWESLLWSAVFAPLLMFFLWASLTIAIQIPKQQVGQNGQGSLAGLLADPTNAGSLNAFFVYFIILGLLFVSLKLTNFFSQKIGGINFASALAGAPITLGSRFLAAPLLRSLVGRGASRLQGQFEASRDAAATAAALRNVQAQHFGKDTRFGKLALREADKLQRSAAFQARLGQFAGNIANSKMNLMNTQGAKQLAKAAGLKGFATGESAKSEKGYADKMKAKAEAAEKAAPKLSDDQKKLVRESAAGAAAQQRSQARDALKQAKKSTADMVAAVKKVAEEQRATLKTQHDDAKETLRRQKDDSRRNQQMHEQQMNRMTEGPAKEAMKTQRESQMRSEEANIEKAQQEVNRLQSALNDVGTTAVHEMEVDGKKVMMSVNEALAADRGSDAALAKHDNETKREMQKAGDSAVENARVDVAVKIGQQSIINPVGIAFGDRKKVAKDIRGLMKKKSGAEGKLVDLLKGAGYDLGSSAGNGGGKAESSEKK